MQMAGLEILPMHEQTIFAQTKDIETIFLTQKQKIL